MGVLRVTTPVAVRLEPSSYIQERSLAASWRFCGVLMTEFRQLTSDDQEQLWNWFHIALRDPPPAGLRPREILQNPDIRIYVERWGQPGDVGVVAVVDGTDIGACWMRLLPPGVGSASVDEHTPQLGIALLPDHQHKGHGTGLLHAGLTAAATDGYCQVSLTVHPENPAISLYERCGFRKIGVRNTYDLMVAAVS